MTSPASPSRPAAPIGLVMGIGAYILWGLLPLYLWLLRDVPADQILAHRVLWSLLLLAGVAAIIGRLPAILKAARGRVLGLLCLSAVLIAINWVVFMWAIQHGHVLETSLGYFINPLVNVALGVALLGERLRRMQGVAIALAACGVAVMIATGGGAIGISITLALSFGLYGLVRKVVAIDAMGGLLVETLLLAPLAIGWLWWLGPAGKFGADGTRDLLLVLAGPVTAAPLLLFAAAARRLPLATLGLLQYVAPTMQFLEAVLVFGEPLRPVHLVTFALIWAGLILYATDAVRHGRRRAAVTPPE